VSDDTKMLSVVAYVFGTESLPGEFAVRAERGPTPGSYRVEVRQDATRWLSNARDPVLQKTQTKLRDTGGLSPQDLQEWEASARAKDQSPSLESQRVYRRLRPGDPAEMTLEVQAGAEARLDLDIVSRP
jgi:hypothetical protein